MIITLVRADFSKANIGTLDSFAVLTNLGPGFSYNGPVFALKGASFSASIVLNSNCTLKSFDVTMGGKSLPDSYVIEGNTISINISAVTGLIAITGVAEGDVSIPDVWYITSLNDLDAAGVNLTGGTKLAGGNNYTPWAYDENFNSRLVGKTINAMEIVPSASGTFTIGKVNASTFVYTKMATFTIDSADINTRKIYTFKPYTINEGEYFTFNDTGDSGLGYYVFTKDANGVEGVAHLNANCDAGSFTNFPYQIIPVFNIGYKAGIVDDTPEVEEPEIPVEPEEPDFPDTPVVDGNTTWYVQSLKQLQDSGNDLKKKVVLTPNQAYSWAFQESMNDKLVNKTINTIEMIPEKTGDFYIGKYNVNSKTVTDKRVLKVETAGAPVLFKFDDLTINEGEFFVWNCSGAKGEAAGYYILKANVDPLAVETSGWYQAKSTGLAPFSNYELAYIVNIGYTAE